MGWQTRAGSGYCSFREREGGAGVTLEGHAPNFGCKSLSVWFDASPSGSIVCREESEVAVGQRRVSAPGNRCTAIRAAVLQLVTRRIELLEHGAEEAAAAKKVSELQSLDNEHLPLGERVAVLMTGELRTFKHAVSDARWA